MAATEKPTLYPVGSDEKVANIMVYTATSIVSGEVVVKEIIRVSTWLRTNNAPDNLRLYNSRLMMTNSSTPRPITLPEVHLSINQVLAYHLIPPAKDPLDYDPSEPNRKMEPVTAVVSSFRMDGMMRMASIINLGRYLEVTREMFTGLYEVDITSPVLTSLRAMHVPFLLVRQATTLFATRPA